MKKIKIDIPCSIFSPNCLSLLLLLSHLSRIQLCAIPQTAAHQAPLSLGFSRQEDWSGLPFPSPMHESEKWKRSRSVVSDSSRPHGLQPTRLLRPWDFPGKSTGVGCHCPLHWPLCYSLNTQGMSVLLRALAFAEALPRTLCSKTDACLAPSYFLIIRRHLINEAFPYHPI